MTTEPLYYKISHILVGQYNILISSHECKSVEVLYGEERENLEKQYNIFMNVAGTIYWQNNVNVYENETAQVSYAFPYADFKKRRSSIMKKTKRNISIVLIFAILFALMPKQVYAIKKVRLNKSKLSLYVGKKYTLKVKNTNKKVKWSSTKKKIATVTKKGKVIAKKKGNCNIIAKVGRKI